MATLVIPDVDDQALERLKARLATRGSSVEDEVRDMITERAKGSIEERRQRAREAMAELKRHADSIEATYGRFPDSTEMLRQERET